MKRLLSLAFLSTMGLLLPACIVDASTQDSKNEDASAASKEKKAPGQSVSPASAASCQSPRMCERVFLPNLCDQIPASSCLGPNSNVKAALGADQIDAIQCVLEKLRAGEVGEVEVHLQIQPDYGNTPCGRRIELVNFGDGTASLVDVKACDIGSQVVQNKRVKLQSKAFYDACLASSDPAKLIACAESLTTERVVQGKACPCREDDRSLFTGRCDANL